MDFNIESTDDIVDYINDILYKKCGKTLRIEFDLFDEMTTGKPLEYFDIFDPDAETPLMLCLFLGKNFISIITFKIKNNTYCNSPILLRRADDDDISSDDNRLFFIIDSSELCRCLVWLCSCLLLIVCFENLRLIRLTFVTLCSLVSF